MAMKLPDVKAKINKPKLKPKPKPKSKVKVKPDTVAVKEQSEFLSRFYELMFELDLYNKFKKTYSLQILKKTNYGYYAHIYLSSGLSFKALKEKKTEIEENLQCMWIMNITPFQEYAGVQIVLKSVDVELEYGIPKIKPWEMYLGLSLSQNIIKNNNDDKCMFLIAGATGSGKTRFIYMILLSWILSCSPKDVWLYIGDIAKNEYINFQDVQHVKYYASELIELYEMMEKIKQECARRKKLISQLREQKLGTNIDDYNKIYKANKMSYCYILIDEFSVVLPDKTDSQDDKKMKEYILDILKTLSKTGRSFGIFCIIATQKVTRDEIPPIIKSMSAVRLSFRANDGVSSEVIMGDSSAMGLADRVAVYSLNGGSIQDYLFSPKITIEKLNELLAPHLKNKQTTVNTSKTSKITKGKVTPISKSITNKGQDILQLLSPNKKEDDYIDH